MKIKRLITQARLLLEEAYESSSSYDNRARIEPVMMEVRRLENEPFGFEEE